MSSELPLPHPIGYSKGEWVVYIPFYLRSLFKYELALLFTRDT